MKFNNILLFASILAVAAGCAKEQVPASDNNDGLVKMTFKASTAEETKTALDADGRSVNWSEGDKISVFALNDGAVASHTAFAASNPNGVYADFEGSTDAEATDFVALYPYNANASVSNGYLYTSVPYAQKAIKDGYDPALNMMLATTTKENSYFGFRNLCALLKLTIPSEMINVTAVSLRTRLVSSGKIKYNLTDNRLETIEDNPGKTLSLVSSDGLPIAPGTYYLVMLANPYDQNNQQIQSLSVAFSDGTVSTIGSKNKQMNIEANKIYNLGTLNISNAKEFKVTNAPTSAFPVGADLTYQLKWEGTEGTPTFVSRSKNIATVDENGLVTFTGKIGVEHIHVKCDGVECPVVFNVAKGYYREDYTKADPSSNVWYKNNLWNINSSHKGAFEWKENVGYMVTPKATDKTTYYEFRGDIQKACSAANPVYLNIDYPIVCFLIDDVLDRSISRNITFDVSGEISGALGNNNNTGVAQYSVDGKKLLVYDMTKQKFTYTVKENGANVTYSNSLYGIAAITSTFQIKYADINKNTKILKENLSELQYGIYGFYTFRTLEDAIAYFNITQ